MKIIRKEVVNVKQAKQKIEITTKSQKYSGEYIYTMCTLTSAVKKTKKTCLKSEWNDTSSRFEKLEGRALSLNPSKERVKSENLPQQKKKKSIFKTGVIIEEPGRPVDSSYFSRDNLW